MEEKERNGVKEKSNKRMKEQNDDDEKEESDMIAMKGVSHEV